MDIQIYTFISTPNSCIDVLPCVRKTIKSVICSACNLPALLTGFAAEARSFQLQRGSDRVRCSRSWILEYQPRLSSTAASFDVGPNQSLGSGVGFAKSDFPPIMLLNSCGEPIENCRWDGNRRKFLLILARHRLRVAITFFIRVCSFGMATSAPLLGEKKKGGHSKASIFYGADEYLEDLLRKTRQEKPERDWDGMLPQLALEGKDSNCCS